MKKMNKIKKNIIKFIKTNYLVIIFSILFIIFIYKIKEKETFYNTNHESISYPGTQGCETTCEGHGFKAKECNEKPGCHFEEGRCWSSVGEENCPTEETTNQTTEETTNQTTDESNTSDLEIQDPEDYYHACRDANGDSKNVNCNDLEELCHDKKIHDACEYLQEIKDEFKTKSLLTKLIDLIF